MFLLILQLMTLLKFSHIGCVALESFQCFSPGGKLLIWPFLPKAFHSKSRWHTFSQFLRRMPLGLMRTIQLRCPQKSLRKSLLSSEDQERKLVKLSCLGPASSLALSLLSFWDGCIPVYFLEWLQLLPRQAYWWTCHWNQASLNKWNPTGKVQGMLSKLFRPLKLFIPMVKKC